MIMQSPKWKKAVTCMALVGALVASSVSQAAACCGIYIGSDLTENGSTFVGRSEDIGKLYGKVFEVHPAEDHEEGDIYKDTYGFSMPYPAHTYRYTVMRDSIYRGETILDSNGNYAGLEAYGEAGINEKGVAVSATVSTYCKNAQKVDPLNSNTGLCEISLNSVILMQAETAKDGVEKLAAILDQYGSGECNSLTISDANEVWDFEIVSGHQYIAYKMPKDKVSVNPNLLIMREMDISDTENVIASPDIIKLPLENGFLVSSQLQEKEPGEADTESAAETDDTAVQNDAVETEPKTEPETTEITLIDVAKTYGSDIGKSNNRYWQGVYYLTGEDGKNAVGDMLLDTGKTFSTYDVLRSLAYRGEGTSHDGNVEGASSSIGNERQAECHIFEIRENMPEPLAILQWQAMSRAEYSVYLPFYSALLTDTSELYKSEYHKTKLADGSRVKEVTQLLEDPEFPKDTSINWVFSAINDLCDNDRERYGTNVKKFFEQYQKELIAKQEKIDADMVKLYNESPEQAEVKATELGIEVAEEAFGYAHTILTELIAFTGEHGEDDEVFVPSVLKQEDPDSDQNDNKGGSHKHSSSGGSGSAVSTEVEQEQPAAGEEQSAESGSPVTFDDVKSDAWYHDAVDYVSGKKLMNGTGAAQFSPEATITRGMAVTILYHLAKEPSAAASNFSDVSAEDYYAKAVAWAAENNIVHGYGNGRFKPNDVITREQLAVILYGYAAYSKADSAAQSGEFTDGGKQFADSGSISSYAANAVTWAAQNGYISGTAKGMFLPQSGATRAEAAQIIMNFCKGTEK